MDLLAVSDLHLNESSRERTARFLQWLEAARDRGDRVLIAGDLFDLWFGWRHLTFPYQRQVIDRMKELKEQGLVMYYVEGNRDFAVSEHTGSLFERVSPDRMTLPWGGIQVSAEHGDTVNADDRPYRTWRRLCKNRLSFFLLRHLPALVLLPLASFLHRRMQPTNRKHKAQYPEEHVRRLVARRATAGAGDRAEEEGKPADIVVIGHFHCERQEEIAHGKRTVLFYNLPGWEEGLRYLVIPREGQPHFKDMGR